MNRICLIPQMITPRNAGSLFFVVGFLICTLSIKAQPGAVANPSATNPPTAAVWQKLKTEPYRGKQDDIYFVNPDMGWYCNGAGKIFKTTDGGATWIQKISQPGTYFRCLGFIDEQHGFAGNIGPDYFPGVTDSTPLYETTDGGDTWKPVTSIKGGIPKGLCAIDVFRKPFINAGQLDYKTILHAAGRVGGPACLLKSDDNGATWSSQDLGQVCGMILDVKFLEPNVGVICAASSADVEKSHALIVMTEDGGKTWNKKFESQRPYELTWKASFPSRNVGYVTLQNYDPDKAVTERFVAKTTDGGNTWVEIPLVNDKEAQEFGVGFIDEERGWVGGFRTGYETIDAGKTWKPNVMGAAVNKIRLLKTDKGVVGYAIGVNIYKLLIN